MFSSYGLPLGEAFQMRDDLLGAFGDAAITGKPVGGDFVEGKRTPLLAYAYEKATGAQREVLDAVGSTRINVEKVQEVVIATGAVAQLEGRIASLRDQAVRALKQSEIAGVAYNELIALADVVTQRER
jgi:geranylgeranyl diphosphate synthase type I